MFGMGEILIIALIILVLLGAKRLPQVGNALGKSVKMFRRGLEDGESKTRDVEEVKKPEKDPSP